MNKELLDKAREMSNTIFEKMRIVEECDALAGRIEGKQFVFMNEDNSVIDMTGVLNEDQIETIRNMSIIAIKSNAEDAEKWLEQIAGFKPEEPIKTFADGKDVPEETKAELTIEAVQELLDKGMTQKAIAEELGATKSRVNHFITKNKLKANTPR